jgi:ssDNA-binding replication factor A large subunit
MKMVTIAVCAKPKSFRDVKFTEDEYKAAEKTGPLKVPYGTAMENLKNSKGLYEIQQEYDGEVDLKVGGQSIATMSKEQVVIAATSLGITVKKGIQLERLREAVKIKMQEILDSMDEEPDE